MQQNLLPGTDLSVSQLCFGCWGITSDNFHWGQREEADSLAAMNAAVEGGVNFFDTAPMYADGASETLLGKFVAQHGLRDQLVIASKIRPDKMRADDVIQECEDSLSRLQMDYLDLYQTHWTSREVPLPETWDAMQRLQQQGKVRQIGVCNMGVGDLSEITSIQKPTTNQIPYNLLWRMIESEVQPKCLDEQIGILVYSPLQHGILSGKYKQASDVPDGRARSRHFSSDRPLTRHGQPGCETATFAAINQIAAIAEEAGRSMPDVALAWLASQPGITSVIAGARNADQAIQNIACLEKPLASEMVEKLSTATAELKTVLGANPDMWDDRYR